MWMSAILAPSLGPRRILFREVFNESLRDWCHRSDRSPGSPTARGSWAPRHRCCPNRLKGCVPSAARRRTCAGEFVRPRRAEGRHRRTQRGRESGDQHSRPIKTTFTRHSVLKPMMPVRDGHLGSLDLDPCLCSPNISTLPFDDRTAGVRRDAPGRRPHHRSVALPARREAGSRHPGDCVLDDSARRIQLGFGRAHVSRPR